MGFPRSQPTHTQAYPPPAFGSVAARWAAEANRSSLRRGSCGTRSLRSLKQSSLPPRLCSSQLHRPSAQQPTRRLAFNRFNALEKSEAARVAAFLWARFFGGAREARRAYPTRRLAFSRFNAFGVSRPVSRSLPLGLRRQAAPEAQRPSPAKRLAFSCSLLCAECCTWSRPSGTSWQCWYRGNPCVRDAIADRKRGTRYARRLRYGHPLHPIGWL